MMSLKDNLDLEKAFRRVLQDKRDDVWPDIVGYRDYRLDINENLADLYARIANPNSYKASLPLGIDLPKQGFTLRPGVVPLINDRVLYQSIADFLAPYFTPESCVYSNRLSENHNSRRMFVPGVELWLEFQGKVKELCNLYPFVVEIDITAYFDHISHDLLLHRLDDLFHGHIDRKILRQSKQLLQRLLKRWNRYGSRFGIPQMNDASSFFGNLYLDELDKWMIRHDYIFLRYVDDMRIFVSDEPSARKALMDLIIQLRSIGMYVASSKTAIRRTDEVLAELGKSIEHIEPIESNITSGNPAHLERAAQLLEDLFIEIVENELSFNDRLFRYSVNRFKKLKVTGLGKEIHSRVVTEVLNRLVSMPYSTYIFTDYLSLFPNDKSVQILILDFLESPYNIYPWQEMLLLELLIRLNIMNTERVTSIARLIALSQAKHPACRAKALVLWGKNGDYADRREIRGLYDNEPREDIRRAILVAIQEMQTGERDNFFQSVSIHSPKVSATAKYVQSLNQPTYHYYNPPSAYELIVDAYDDSDDLDDLGSEYFLY